MKRIFLPLASRCSIVAVVFLPPEIVAVVGCRNRDLWAVAIALLSSVVGLYMKSIAVAARWRRNVSGYTILAALFMQCRCCCCLRWLDAFAVMIRLVAGGYSVRPTAGTALRA